jgi:hypothetical protein
MKTVRFLLGSAVLLVLHASTSLAQAQRTFVSGLGNDGNPCTRLAPCRTFQVAIDATAPSGEAIALDSEQYGSFTIAKAITVEAPLGVYAAVAPTINVSAGPADIVVLRGLQMTRVTNDADGIDFFSGGALHVEGCTLNSTQRLTGAAINVQGGSKLFVDDSVLANNVIGVTVNVQSGTDIVSVYKTQFFGNNVGLWCIDAKCNISRSVISGGGSALVAGTNSPTAVAELNAENCLLANNNIAGVDANIQGGGVATVRISNCTVTDNAIGLQQESGTTVLTRGNNTVEGNSTNTMGTIGSYPAK